MQCLCCSSLVFDLHFLVYFFATASISTILSCAKMVKIAAIRSVFATKNLPKDQNDFKVGSPPRISLSRLLVGWGKETWLGRETPLPISPLLDAERVSISSVFGASTLSASTRCPSTRYEKSAPMVFFIKHSTNRQLNVSKQQHNADVTDDFHLGVHLVFVA